MESLAIKNTTLEEDILRTSKENEQLIVEI